MSQKSSDKIEKKYKKNKLTVKVQDKKVKTLEDLMRHAGIDKNLWKVESFSPHCWEQAIKEGGSETLYKAEATFRFKEEENLTESLIKHFHQQAKLSNSTHVPVKYEAKKEKNLYAILIFDAHFGKLAWNKASQYDDYDVDITATRFSESINELLTRVDHNKIERILFPIGNDFFNTEGATQKTAAGTEQENDSRWAKTFARGCECLVNEIEKLSKVAPVDVIHVMSNHDYTTGFYAAEYIRAWFRGDKNVTITVSPRPRNYYTYGTNLIGLTHGNTKKTELPMLMAKEARAEWAKTNEHIWLMGHFHSEKTECIGGVNIATLPTICEPDMWHSEAGYCLSYRGAQGFLFNKIKGLVARFTHKL